MPQTGIWITFLASGLLGSVGHCLGMCGPLNLMLGGQIRKNDLARLPNFTLYHFMRVVVYIIFGTIIGAAGSLLGISRQLTTIGGITGLLLGGIIIVFGLQYLGLFKRLPFGATGGWWNDAFNRAIRAGGWRGIALMGAVNGLLPCGLVYSALLLAASSGNAVSGAIGMAIFGLGTFPTLLALDLGSGAIAGKLRSQMLRAAGGFMILVGLQLFLRGGAALHFWPHLHWGGIVFW
jgi:sulfite exporter TauE/SafE